LFGYCRRYYARQFQTRASAQNGVLARLQRHLDDYLASSRPREKGLPTVALCARSLGYSPDYLSDLLREETGTSARDHIHRALIEAAKRRLAASTDSISEIAYALGFEQPQHFSKLFKQKTGRTPGEWRG
jgi:AraC family transcriptional activator of pobA